MVCTNWNALSPQDVVNQLEVECVQLEEEILERQIQMETTGHPVAETENLDNHRERLRFVLTEDYSCGGLARACI